jgi:hypothetical protein
MPITVPINPIKGALQRRAVGDAALEFDLPFQLFIAEIEDGNQGRGAELLARHHHGFHAAGLAERSQKAGIRLGGAAQGAHLGENNGPGIE